MRRVTNLPAAALGTPPTSDAGASSDRARLEASRYRSLRAVSQEFGLLTVLAGPHGGGKSNLLDVAVFLADLLRGGLNAAIAGDEGLGIAFRTSDARDLTWLRQGDPFELAVELPIPLSLRGEGHHTVCRYEVAVDVSEEPRLAAETLWLMPPPGRLSGRPQGDTPGNVAWPPERNTPRGCRKVVARGADAEDVTFRAESTRWQAPFHLSATEPALAAMPGDPKKFPVSVWFRETLRRVHRVALSTERMRLPAPPPRRYERLSDGSNLPHLIHSLRTDSPESYDDWTTRIRATIPGVAAVTTTLRPEDRHRYLAVRYADGIVLPSWLLSDGALRLLALTLLPYLAHDAGLLLVEDPENGLTPHKVDAVFSSLSSVTNATVVISTHSPQLLSAAHDSQVLCVYQVDAKGTRLENVRDNGILRDCHRTTASAHSSPMADEILTDEIPPDDVLDDAVSR